MLAVARMLPTEGASVEWVEGSALDLPFSAGDFDLVLCQLGCSSFQTGGARFVKCTGCCGHSPIERTPGANAFVMALDRILGPGSSKIKRGEHFLQLASPTPKSND
jgi:hypothetical protein